LVVGINGNICGQESALHLYDPGDVVWETGTVTTTSTAKTKIVEYTVPTGKDFYLINYSLTRRTDNQTGATPVSLEIETSGPTFTVRDTGAIPDGSSVASPEWQGSNLFGNGIKVATAGEKVQIYVVAGRPTGTSWFAKIVGVLQDV
jgi:hypothetical protein